MNEIINGTLVIQNKKKVDILKDLQEHGYESFEKEDGYGYLLSMQLWNLTHEKVKAFIKLGAIHAS